jgi:hypothetical protein
MNNKAFSREKVCLFQCLGKQVFLFWSRCQPGLTGIKITWNEGIRLITRLAYKGSPESQECQWYSLGVVDFWYAVILSWKSWSQNICLCVESGFFCFSSSLYFDSRIYQATNCMEPFISLFFAPMLLLLLRSAKTIDILKPSFCKIGLS